MTEYSIRVEESATRADGELIWPVYDAVFADTPDFATWWETVWDRHRLRHGFRVARAFGTGGELVGFVYGYTGEHGQWWTDNAAKVLEARVGRAWLGGHFEVVSLAVSQAARRRGIGRRLLRSLTRGLPHDRLLLQTTADPTDPARRLYESEGWQVLGPGVGNHRVIMGKGTPRACSVERSGTDRSPRPTTPAPGCPGA